MWRTWFLLLLFSPLTGCALSTLQTFDDESERRSIPPFWVEERSKDPPVTKGAFLWPLGSYKRTPDRSRIHFLPFFLRHDRYRDEGPDWDAITALVLFNGHDPQDGGHFAVFPFGGTVKNRLLSDRIDFVLFPLWARSWNGDVKSDSFLWPIFKWTRGGNVQGGGVWPLYRRYRKHNDDGELAYDRRWILFPFYTHLRSGLDTDRPTEVKFYFPFYGRIDAPSFRDRAWLFPFIRHRVEWGQRRREEWRAPFPFITIGWGENYRRRDFWPLYGTRTSDDDFRRYVLWPLFYQGRKESSDGGRRVNYLLPFYVNTRRWDAAGQTTQSNRKLWPLYGNRLSSDGSRTVEVLSPLWFEDRLGGVDLFGTFWRLYGRTTRPDGEAKTTLGFGLVQYVTRPQADDDWRVLWGLFGRETVRGKRRTRLFFFRW